MGSVFKKQPQRLREQNVVLQFCSRRRAQGLIMSGSEIIAVQSCQTLLISAEWIAAPGQGADCPPQSRSLLEKQVDLIFFFLRHLFLFLACFLPAPCN